LEAHAAAGEVGERGAGALVAGELGAGDVRGDEVDLLEERAAAAGGDREGAKAHGGLLLQRAGELVHRALEGRIHDADHLEIRLERTEGPGHFGLFEGRIDGGPLESPLLDPAAGGAADRASPVLDEV